MSSKILMILAAAAGLLSLVFSEIYLNMKERNFIRKHKPDYILVATRDIMPGETIKPEDIDVREIPGRFEKFNEMALHGNPDRSLSRDAVSLVNRASRRMVAKNEPFIVSDLVVASPARLEEKLGDNERALPIPVVATNSQLFRPGDWVDVVVVSDDDGAKTARVAASSMNEFPAVQILALGNRFGDYGDFGDEAKYDTVTVKLSLENAQRMISLLAGKGSPRAYLLLRKAPAPGR